MYNKLNDIETFFINLRMLAVCIEMHLAMDCNNADIRDNFISRSKENPLNSQLTRLYMQAERRAWELESLLGVMDRDARIVTLGRLREMLDVRNANSMTRDFNSTLHPQKEAKLWTLLNGRGLPPLYLQVYKTIHFLESKILIIAKKFSVSLSELNGICNDVITSDTTTTSKAFEYNPKEIEGIFGFCDNTGVFKDVLFHKFAECVAQADFSTIQNKKGTVKSKLKRIITKINSILDNEEWYRQAAQSIGVTPSGCSGANVPEDWLRQLNALK